jgi:type IV pilus assembly protein PilB
VELGLIGDRDLELALQLQKEVAPKRKLGEVLVDHNLIEERQLIGVLSMQLGFPFIEPDLFKIDPDLFQAGFRCANTSEHNFIPVRIGRATKSWWRSPIPWTRGMWTQPRRRWACR